MDKLIELITQIKLPRSEDEATNELLDRLDEKAHEQGLSGAMELMMQDPGLRGIMVRMIGSELKARKLHNDVTKGA